MLGSSRRFRPAAHARNRRDIKRPSLRMPGDNYLDTHRWSDPTHVRAFTPLTFWMMSKKQNDEWIAKRANYTMLAHVM